MPGYGDVLSAMKAATSKGSLSKSPVKGKAAVHKGRSMGPVKGKAAMCSKCGGAMSCPGCDGKHDMGNGSDDGY